MGFQDTYYSNGTVAIRVDGGPTIPFEHSYMYKRSFFLKKKKNYQLIKTRKVFILEPQLN